MKNLTKIFMAVVAGMFAFSCVTDTTEDLGVELGNEAAGKGETLITLSMTKARTHIDKEVDGKYPMYWSESDQISVNGVTSTAIAISSENKSVATFTIPSDNLGDTWNIAYPAAAKNDYVVFAKEQTHTSGTFDNNLTTMYASCKADGDVTLNHLTGVLKIGITGSAVLDKVMVSTIDRKPIAGNFAFDFANGKILSTTPVDVPATDDTEATTKYADANESHIISYSFGKDGLQLTSEAQYIHVVVPAGEYDELYLTLIDKDSQIMYATVKAGESNPLEAGNMRYFPKSVLYTPKEDVFVIHDYKSLCKFATEISTLDKDVVFANDVVVPAAADVDTENGEFVWTPLSTPTSFTKTIYGHGFAVKNLTTPLFASTYATIDALHLENVQIVNNDTAIIGSFVNNFYGTMRNCSAEGSLEYNYPSYNKEVASKFNQINAGGMIGRAKNAVFENCTNYVDITITAMGDPSLAYRKPIGGFVGLMWGTTNSLENITNYGNIYYNENTTGNVIISASGILGIAYNDPTNFTKLANCKNYGTISTPSGSDSNSFSCGGTLSMAGITSGLSYVGWDQCAAMACNGFENHGDIIVNGSCSNSIYAAGLFGGTKTRVMYSNCLNEGNIVINASTGNDLLVGGLAAWEHMIDGNAETPGIRENNTNKGNITINDDLTIAGVVRIGGIAGNMTYQSKNACLGAQFNNNDNYGKISVGSITVEGAADENIPGSAIHVAGLYATARTGKITNCQNLTDAIISVSPTSVTGGCCVAGLIGYITYPAYSWTGYTTLTVTDCSNNASINVQPTSATNVEVAGGIGHFHALSASSTTKLTRVNNNGIITCAGKDYTSTAESYAEGTSIDNCNAVGGLVANTSYRITFSDCHNTKNIVVNPTGSISHVNIGGLIGRTGHFSNDRTSSITNCTNTGNITCSPAETTDKSMVGGLIGHVESYGTIYTNAKLTSSSNSGSITIGGDTKDVYVGGVCGYGIGCANLESTDNNTTGNIIVNTTERNSLYVGGLYGYCKHAVTDTTTSSTFKTCNNYANIDVNSSGSSRFYCGGAVGLLASDIDYIIGFESFCNYGSMTANCETLNNSIYFGGAIGGASSGFSTASESAGVTLTKCKNISTKEYPSKMTIKNGTYKDVFVGGMVGHSYACVKVSNCENSQPLDIKPTKIGAACIGTMCGKLVHNANNLTSTVNTFSNTADYTIAATTMGNVTASLFLGYFNTSGGANTMYLNADSITNTGSLNIGGHSTSACYYGGVIGYPRLGKSYVTVTNSTNSGAINVNGSLTSNLYVGGFFANPTANITVSDSVNNCPITINTGTTQTCALYCVGGFVGVQQGTCSMTRCTNNSAISVSGKATGNANIGGIIGASETNLTLESVGNKGAISAQGVNAAQLYMGGFIGNMTSGKTYSLTTPLTNEGNITVENSTISDAENSYIGGIVGSAATSIDGARVWCTVTTWGFKGNVGMITGSARVADKAVATNCYVGGYIDKGVYKEDQNQSTGEYETKWWPNQVKMGKSNYWKYVYGTRPSENDAESISIIVGDGCGYLSNTIDDTPDYAAVE